MMREVGMAVAVEAEQVAVIRGRLSSPPVNSGAA